MKMNSFKVIIEIPKGNVNNKYEYDEKSGEFKLDFVFGSAAGGKDLVWPYNYGFFPGTLGGDNDPLDAVVLSSSPINQGEEVEVKILGAVDVLDRGEEDYKIICVPISDLAASSANDISDIPEAQKKEWSEFFLELARQKKKETTIRRFKNKKEATELLQKSIIH